MSDTRDAERLLAEKFPEAVVTVRSRFERITEGDADVLDKAGKPVLVEVKSLVIKHGKTSKEIDLVVGKGSPDKREPRDPAETTALADLATVDLPVAKATIEAEATKEADALDQKLRDRAAIEARNAAIEAERAQRDADIKADEAAEVLMDGEVVGLVH